MTPTVIFSHSRTILTKTMVWIVVFLFLTSSTSALGQTLGYLTKTDSQVSGPLLLTRAILPQSSPGIVDGAVDPTRIPDEIAYGAVFKSIARLYASSGSSGVNGFFNQMVIGEICCTTGYTPSATNSDNADVTALVAASVDYVQQINAIDQQAEAIGGTFLTRSQSQQSQLASFDTQKLTIVRQKLDSLPSSVRSSGITNFRRYVDEKIKRQMKIILASSLFGPQETGYFVIFSDLLLDPASDVEDTSAPYSGTGRWTALGYSEASYTTDRQTLKVTAEITGDSGQTITSDSPLRNRDALAVASFPATEHAMARSLHFRINNGTTSTSLIGIVVDPCATPDESESQDVYYRFAGSIGPTANGQLRCDYTVCTYPNICNRTEFTVLKNVFVDSAGCDFRIRIKFTRYRIPFINVWRCVRTPPFPVTGFDPCLS